MPKVVHRLFTVLVGFYLALLALLVIASLLIPVPELSGVIRSGAALLLFPALLLLPLSLLLRRPRFAVLLAVVCAAWLVNYLPLLLMRPRVTTTDARQITLVTFNIQTPDADEVDSLIDVIRATDADVVGVSELSGMAATHFETQLADEYPYQSLYPDEDYDGQGILSRYPITESEYWGSPDWPYGQMRVVLDWEGDAIVIYNLHPSVPLSIKDGFNLEIQPHNATLSHFLEMADTETAPVILLGDFNLTPQFDLYQRITKRYSDSFRAAGEPGLGFTFSARSLLPLLRLDYIFYSSHFTALEARVWPMAGSTDHFPVWTRLALTVDES